MAYLEIALVLLLMLLNGLLAMSELAVASSRSGRLRSLVDQGIKGSRRALALSSDPGRFLASVQIGITLIGIIAGAFSGATLGERLSARLMSLGLGETAADALGFGGVIGAITYLSLIIGELVPKQIALRNPERIACLVAPAMTSLARVAAPVVWLLDRSGRAVLAVIGQKGKRDETVTDAEIHALIEEAETAGVLEPDERSMIAGVMRLADRQVWMVMTPRPDVHMIDIDADPAAIAERIAESGHSRFIAYRNSTDNVLGVIQAKDIALALLRQPSPPMEQLVKPAPIIPETLGALDAIRMLRDSPAHMGLVHDEYGQFEGVVTPTDILEAIVGSFREEDEESEDIAERTDGSFLVPGSLPVDVLADRLGIRLPAARDYNTVAGYILYRMGRVPEAGDTFNDRGFHFEIVDLDGRRIDKVIVSRSAATTQRLDRLR